MEKFFLNLFKRKLRETKYVYNEFLRDISLRTLSQEQKKVCDEEISEPEVILALASFSNNKSPGNDDLTKEFYETTIDEFDKPNKSEQKIGHILKASSNKIIRKVGQR